MNYRPRLVARNILAFRPLGPVGSAVQLVCGWFRLLRLWVVCSVALVLLGCANSFRLMAPPAYVGTEGYSAAIADYYEHVDATPLVDVFYATDRAPSTDGRGRCDYDWARGGALRLGMARVAVGEPSWSMDELTRRSLEGEKIAVDCEQIDEFGLLYTTIPPTSVSGLEAYYSNHRGDPVREASNRFAERINRELARTDSKNVYILVTGLSTRFHLSIAHAAALHHYLGHGGPMIAYPWPTRATPFFVNKDRLSGRISARSLRQLILFLGEETDATRINLIGYSAGAEVLAQALYQLRLANAMVPAEQIAGDLKLGQVVLAAPDVDYAEFRNMLLDRLLDVAEQFTIYVHAEDRVLHYSDVMTTGAPRLGRPQEIVSDIEKALYRLADDVVFVNPKNSEHMLGESDSRGHSYWFENPWVLADVMLTVSTGRTPQQRGLVRQKGKILWEFPDDYERRIEALFEPLPETGKLRRDTHSRPVPD